MKMSDHRYKKVILDLVDRLEEEIKRRDQWDWPEVLDTKVKYQHRAEALLDLIESVTVFHIGGGLTQSFGKGFDYRVSTFKKEFLEELH